MDECDLILASLQEMLLGFQADLGGLSGDIKNLQEQSRSLGCKLQNRKHAENQLRTYLQKIIVPPTLADIICSGNVEPKFKLAVQELERKYQFIHSRSNHLANRSWPGQTPARNEMEQHVTKLRHRAIVRIRSYFLRTIAQLRKPKTNVTIIQTNSLLKYTPLMDFIFDAKVEIYNEIRNVYTESMSMTLFALFRTYAAQLALLDNEIASRKDVIAIEDSTLRDVWTRVNMRKRGDAFCVGSRWEVLQQSPNDVPILAHVALSEKRKYPYEIIFKSMMVHLMDTCTNEYVFVRSFFRENGSDVCKGVLARTLSLILEQLENYLFHCYDSLGLLLMIKLTHSNRAIMKDRGIDVLDKFFESLTNLLWPRLKTIMNKQIRSVRDGDPRKLGVIDFHAHYISRRYAELTCSILQIVHKGQGGKMLVAISDNITLSATGTNHDKEKGRGKDLNGLFLRRVKPEQDSNQSAGVMLLNDLCLLQDETIFLLRRCAESHSSNKNKTIFLINNLDQIISIFQERHVGGKELNHFTKLLMQQREFFVEEELLQNFSKMIAFVQQTEKYLVQCDWSDKRTLSEGHKLEVNTQVVESLVREFASTWKQGIEQINRNVLSFFANFRNGMEVLKQVLTQLLLYYTRFQDIIRKVWRSKPPAFCKDLVSTSTILAEIKKYALAI